MNEIGEELGLKGEELKDHLAILERALLVEREEECYRLTPRCIAYLDETRGYEWRR
jgi:predicted transcriptional regulator